MLTDPLALLIHFALFFGALKVLASLFIDDYTHKQLAIISVIITIVSLSALEIR